MKLDHVQLAAPRGCEELGLGEIEKPEPLRSRGGVWFMRADGVRRFYAQDPWGNRIEIVAAG